MLDYQHQIINEAKLAVINHEPLSSLQGRELIDTYDKYRQEMRDLYKFLTLPEVEFRKEILYPNKERLSQMEWLVHQLYNSLQHMKSFKPDWGVEANKGYRIICETMNRCFPHLETEETLSLNEE